MQDLVKGIRAYLEHGKKNTAAKLSELSGMSTASISRLLNNKQGKVTTDTWLKLHHAAPAHIPLPPLLQQSHHGLSIEPGLGLSFLPQEPGAQRHVPVLEYSAGGGYRYGGGLKGGSVEYICVPARHSDENTFALRVCGNSMAPRIEDGDLAIVVPSHPLEHGRVCLVSNPCEGEKLIRRYFKYGEIVVLRPDNPAAGPEIQISRENAVALRLLAVIEARKANL